MNKRQLTAAAARGTSLNRRQMREAIDAVFETIANALETGDEVVLVEFGRFEARAYPGRELRRFDGPGRYTVEDRLIPVFKSSEVLRRRLRERQGAEEATPCDKR